MSIYVSLPRGYRRVFSDVVQDWSIRFDQPQPMLTLHTHGSGCGQPGALSCEEIVFWNGADFSADLPQVRSR
jgi:hypothetical protein